jgi:hypothetical protein
VWSGRELTSKVNSTTLKQREIVDGFCPRNVTERSNRLASEEGFRAGLKRMAVTEARIGIFKNVFLGKKLLVKGFRRQELAVGWAALTDHSWVIARMTETEKKRKKNQELTTRLYSHATCTAAWHVLWETSRHFPQFSMRGSITCGNSNAVASCLLNLDCVQPAAALRGQPAGTWGHPSLLARSRLR